MKNKPIDLPSDPNLTAKDIAEELANAILNTIFNDSEGNTVYSTSATVASGTTTIFTEMTDDGRFTIEVKPVN